MSSRTSAIGMALMCDNDGRVQSVLQNDFDLEYSDLMDRFLPTLFGPSSQNKALTFLLDLKMNGRFFECELDLPVRENLLIVHCAGLVFENGLLIIVAETRFAIGHLFEGMMRINNEQANLLRSRSKESFSPSASDSVRETGVLDEMMSTNNELVNLQRELHQKNAQLERLTQEVQALARLDQLTGLLNRRGFFELAERELAVAKRFGKPLTAIMLDIDHFKSFNDTYGHATGDVVLREVAQRCSSEIRGVDVIGRYGGEEFAVLLTESDAEIGESTAERVRAIVSATPFETEHGPLRVTISLGVASLSNHSQELSDLLKLADQALYRAKEAGRNRVST